jgi:hypothetical protein
VNIVQRQSSAVHPCNALAFAHELLSLSTHRAFPLFAHRWNAHRAERAETFVVRAGTTYELLVRNALAPEPCLATPALIGDSIILRTASHLYRIRK